jgi:hypothetical protein
VLIVPGFGVLEVEDFNNVADEDLYMENGLRKKLFGAKVRFEHFEMFLQSSLPTLAVQTSEGETYLASVKTLEWSKKDLILDKTQEALRVERFNSRPQARVRGVREFEFHLEKQNLDACPGQLVVMAGPLLLQRVGEFNRKLVGLFSGWAFVQNGFRVTTLSLEEYRKLVEGLADATEKQWDGGSSVGSLVRKGLLALPFFRPAVR